MSMSDMEVLELHELLDGLVENNLSIKQKNKLQSLMDSSDEARMQYVRFMDMSASLKHYAEELVSDDFEESLQPRDKTSRIVQLFRYSTMLAALVVLGIYLFSGSQFFSVSNLQSASTENQAFKNSTGEPILDPVAVLTKLVGIEWREDSSFRPELGTNLEPCLLDLKNGLAQVEFLRGSSAILEAPVEFEIINPNEASLLQGKMRALVPHVAYGFTVNLPHGRIIDLGTEFGLKVHPCNSTEIFVFKGKVLYEGSTGDKDSVTREISGGEALLIDSEGFPNWVEMPNEAFVGAADLAFQSRERSQKKHSAWSKLSKEISENSMTSFYYNFDNHSPWSRVLRDESKNKSDPVNGAIIGCKWTEGRWVGKKALSFKSQNDRVRLAFRKKLPAATFSAWVKLELLNSKLSPLLHSESNSVGASSWFINSKGQLVLEVRNSNGRNQYASAVAFHKERLGRWTHVATSYDNSSKMISHYINGRPISREKIRKVAPLSFMSSSIGHLSKKMHSSKISFTGSIDELVLFKTSLSEKEITRMYEIGSPYESNN